MAEFVQVMNQRDRMCNGKCIDCPLSSRNNGLGVGCYDAIKHNTKKAEEIIMKWAKEHPIKTNADKFKEVFGQSYKDVVTLTYSVSLAEYEKFWNKEYKEPKKEDK